MEPHAGTDPDECRPAGSPPKHGTLAETSTPAETGTLAETSTQAEGGPPAERPLAERTSAERTPAAWLAARPLSLAATVLVAAALADAGLELPIAAWTAAAVVAGLAWLARPRAIGVLFLLFALAGLRAASSGPEARARLDAGREATVRLGAEGRDDVRVELVELGAFVRAPKGSVRDGERVRLARPLAGDPWPRGPFPGPQERAGRATAPAELRADAFERIAAAPVPAWAPLFAPLDALRAALDRRANELDDPLARGFVRAFVLGDANELPEGVPDLFVRTGTYHVLAISGMQVVLFLVLVAAPLASAASAFLAIFLRVRVSAALLRLPSFLVVATVGGAGAPVLRSALACALAPLSTGVRCRAAFRALADGRRAFTGRAPDPASLWSLALCCECLRSPRAPLELGVQLSYAATLGLILGTRPLRAALAPAPERDASGLETPLLRTALHRVARVVAGALAASIAAVLATLPFTWTRFGEWSPAGLVATPLSVPPMGLLLLGAWLWLALPPFVLAAAPDGVPEVVLGTLARVDRPARARRRAARLARAAATAAVRAALPRGRARLHGVGARAARRRARQQGPVRPHARAPPARRGARGSPRARPLAGAARARRALGARRRPRDGAPPALADGRHVALRRGLARPARRRAAGARARARGVRDGRARRRALPPRPGPPGGAPLGRRALPRAPVGRCAPRTHGRAPSARHAVHRPRPGLRPVVLGAGRARARPRARGHGERGLARPARARGGPHGAAPRRRRGGGARGTPRPPRAPRHGRSPAPAAPRIGVRAARRPARAHAAAPRLVLVPRAPRRRGGARPAGIGLARDRGRRSPRLAPRRRTHARGACTARRGHVSCPERADWTRPARAGRAGRAPPAADPAPPPRGRAP
ncbi:MAG: ComEC/Rec2 family competence protein [Planctomycetes bacterium]|nr:ComEC/Rec2 family competence protein [Planctomycetota bacterium]